MTSSARYCIIIDALPNLTVSDYFLLDESRSLRTLNILICFVNVRAINTIVISDALYRLWILTGSNR